MDEHRSDRLRGAWQQLLRFGERLLDAFFHPGQDWLSRGVGLAWMAALLLYGVYLWGVFFSWGNISFDFLDWGEVIGPRYAVLHDAAVTGQLPLHVSNTSGLRGVTDRYLAIADTPLSPQFLLMRFVPEIGTFAFYNHILFYLIGFAGLAWIGWKYRLSPAAFGVLFLLFNLNGHLVSHVAVGHLNWSAHFLLPYFVLLMLALVEGRHGWKWVLGLAVLMLVILLQGGFHLYVWCLIFMGVLGIAYPRLFKPVLIGGLFAGLVGAVRLLPPAADLSLMDPEMLNGFPTVTHMLAGLIELREPLQAFEFRNIVNALAWWELDTYIGLLGLAFLAWFGVVLLLRKHAGSPQAAQAQDQPLLSAGYEKLLVPSLALAVLSLAGIYHFLASRIPFPLLAGERVTSRFLIVPVVFVLVLAVLAFQAWLNHRKQSPLEQVLWLVGLYVLRTDLLQHMDLWRIRYIDGLVEVFPKLNVDLNLHAVANRPDPLYTNLLLAGLVISLLSLAFLIWMALRRQQVQRAA